MNKKSKVDERLDSLFVEMWERNIIDKKIKLTINYKTSNFQGLNIFSIKRIRYNPVFFRESLSKFSDDIIRFVLLHEVGHISSGSWLRIENIVAVVTIVAIATIFVINNIFHDFLVRFLLWVLVFGALVLTIRVLVQSMFKSLKNLEFQADEFAFEKMRINYEIPNPCTFIDDCFNIMTAIQKDVNLREKLKPTFFQKLIVRLCSLEDDYHPTNEERVIRLKKIARCNEHSDQPELKLT
jgi:Zn-dependent protease with chaperone function